uniref:Homeobox domain-containing protein n=1 Tax=Mesocestoides corti TaxID=53468 RepID=A0A5K3FU85_MESCO
MYRKNVGVSGNRSRATTLSGCRLSARVLALDPLNIPGWLNCRKDNAVAAAQQYEATCKIYYDTGPAICIRKQQHKHIATDGSLSRLQPARMRHSGCDASLQTDSKSSVVRPIWYTLDNEQYSRRQIEPLELRVQHKPPSATNGETPSPYQPKYDGLLHDTPSNTQRNSFNTNANLVFSIRLPHVRTYLQTHRTNFHDMAEQQCKQIDSTNEDLTAKCDTQQAATSLGRFSVDDCRVDYTSTSGTRKRKCAHYSKEQVKELEQRFIQDKYIGTHERRELARRLGLTDIQRLRRRNRGHRCSSIGRYTSQCLQRHFSPHTGVQVVVTTQQIENLMMPSLKRLVSNGHVKWFVLSLTALLTVKCFPYLPDECRSLKVGLPGNRTTATTLFGCRLSARVSALDPLYIPAWLSCGSSTAIRGHLRDLLRYWTCQLHPQPAAQKPNRSRYKRPQMSAFQSGEFSKHIAMDGSLTQLQPPRRLHSGCDASTQTDPKSWGDGTIGNTLDSEQYGEEQIEPLDLSVRSKPPPATTCEAPSGKVCSPHDD